MIMLLRLLSLIFVELIRSWIKWHLTYRFNHKHATNSSTTPTTTWRGSYLTFLRGGLVEGSFRGVSPTLRSQTRRWNDFRAWRTEGTISPIRLIMLLIRIWLNRYVSKVSSILRIPLRRVVYQGWHVAWTWARYQIWRGINPSISSCG